MLRYLSRSYRILWCLPQLAFWAARARISSQDVPGHRTCRQASHCLSIPIIIPKCTEKLPATLCWDLLQLCNSKVWLSWSRHFQLWKQCPLSFAVLPRAQENKWKLSPIRFGASDPESWPPKHGKGPGPKCLFCMFKEQSCTQNQCYSFPCNAIS